MLSNYGWLVIAATMASLSIPINYWLAGQLGGGAVSIWAVGSKLVQMATVLGAAMLQAVWVPYFSKLARSGLHMRIRSEFYLSLIASSWGGGLLALLVFVFAGPIVMVAMPAVQDEMRVVALTGVIQIGGLQLPVLFSGLALLKLAAISEVSWKVVSATLIGLVANVVLGYKFMQIWGLYGIAAAWCLATLLVTMVILIATRARSFLGWADIFAIICSWMVIGAFALAIHFNSLAVTVAVILFGILMLVIQVKTLIIRTNAL
jgi:O-antigen/teichoic acid export membrane protein